MIDLNAISLSNLPDGTLINGVANFYRATKPLTRVDGSALVIGDRWVNPSTGVEGFWNGTYWVSELKTQTASISHTYTSTVNQGATGIIVDNSAYDLLLISTALRFNTAGTVSGTNYWILKLVNILFGGVVDYTYDLNVTAGDYGETTGNVYKTSPLLNQYIALTNNAIQFQIRSQAAPSSGSFTAALTYREVYR